MKYHAHVYFDLAQIRVIERLYAELQQEFGKSVSYGRIHQKLVGPHTKPMFQLEFDHSNLPQVRTSLSSSGLGLSVLIHPLIENSYVAHTQKAEWIGEVLPLNLNIFL